MRISRKLVVVALLGLFVALLVAAGSITLDIILAFPRKTGNDYYRQLGGQCMGSAPLKVQPLVQLGDREARNRWHIERMETAEKNQRYCTCIVTEAARKLPPPKEPFDLYSPEGAAKLQELARPCMAELQ